MSSDDLQLIFEAGGRRFAIPASRVVEVVRHEDAGAEMLLVDLNEVLGGPATLVGPDNPVVVVRFHSAGDRPRCVGFVVDAAVDIVSVPAADLLPPPDLGPNIELHYLSALARSGGALCIVLAVDELMSALVDAMELA